MATPTGDGARVRRPRAEPSRAKRSIRSSGPGGPYDAPSLSRVPVGYLLRKIGTAAGTLVFVVIVNFFLFRILPGDPAKAFSPRGRNSDPERLAQIRESFGIGKPWYEQLWNYISGLARFDLGISWSTKQPVAHLIGEKLWATMLLSGTSLVIAAVVGAWLGARAGWRHGSRFDRWSSGVAVTLYSIPEWWLGLMLVIVFAASGGLGIFPTSGMVDPRSTLPEAVDVAYHLVLPCLTLVIVYIAEYSLIMRSSVLDERRADYLTTARAKGLRDDLVLRRHAVPNAILPSLTLFFLSLGFVISGAITVETVFTWPGLGRLTYDALKGPDIPLLQGLFLVFSFAVIAMNLVADLIVPIVDPRVRAA